ncbi:T9SS type A sorting domain-containing protein [Hymenobacter baengnokdamensis]|uniref:T9SS type A sorting domain-containing protein n=1 Tax=Hymenobacter baengnokdamensis TaxID=2615203 RepID=UPI00178740B1|nr:T9SS type A sorting domain-containing protein [Hymenobacter baengnokdamensis]
MLTLEIMKFIRMARSISKAAVLVALLLAFSFVKQQAHAAAYYSTGAPKTYTPLVCAVGCSGVNTSVTTPATSIALSAEVNIPVAGPARLKYQLNGVGQPGYRAGILLSTTSTLLGGNALGTVTIRTYLSSGPTPTVPQDQQVITGTAAQAQLLAGKGSPSQLELIATAPFDQVEVEFGSAISLGSKVDIYYAYGIGPNTATQVTGLTSNSNSAATTSPYSVTGCTDKVSNAGQAADSDPTNYATFSSLLSVSCPAQLTVGLNGTAPGSYQAGFVIGQDNTLLDASVLSHLTLKTYKNGVLQETASGASLLSLGLLPDSKSLVSFQATMPFDAVSIERSDAASALDNLQLYYGVGVASTTPQQTLSSFASPTGHYAASSSGVCVACSVTSPANAAGDPNSAASINVGVGVANWAGLQLDLNGQGRAGNRAGMVIGSNTPLDVAALSRMTLVTYDDNGNVLETASGSSLLSLNVLPDGRQTVSFNTTKDFSKVGIQMGGLATAASSTSVYYAFSDSSNGSLKIVPPTGPLPVTLLSLAVRRLAGTGAAEISWTTATELNNAGFVVERTADPATSFVAVGQVAGEGTSGSQHSYKLGDEAAAQATGTLYYRLRQLDTNGHATLSPVVVLAPSNAPVSFSLYPNPATTTSQVTLGSSSALVAGTSVNVYSSLGQLLSSQVLSPDAAASPVHISTTSLAPGLYQVVLRSAAGLALTTQRLVVAGQ